MKKVSIIMSVFGYESYVEATINSILEQTLDDFEFIVIDDNCSYNLKGLINNGYDRRIKYFKNETNLGLTKSLIKGIKYSSGKYIARIDAGNIALPDRLNKQYAFLEDNHDYYLIGSSYEVIDEYDKTICRVLVNTDNEFIAKNLPKYNLLNHSSIMFRNEGVVNYREKFIYSQDYDLYLNLLSRGFGIGNIPDVLSKERLISRSITYLKKGIQDYYKKFAQEFYFERIEKGSDSYDILEYNRNTGKKASLEELNGVVFFYKQKVHYLLYSGRYKEARKQISAALKKRYNNKLLLYYFLSFFPALLRMRGKKEDFSYE